ncbi:non-ribosomal peptide synthase/polyketide synthase [Amycolatopsis cihanbeyliensis]|uniref:Amino acid adenylation domain-containing protein n=1 Tax=Amycolatopsis cihanbeyliensis TaxID=1128664 RepID=A0A542DBJ1_AMYCI|nr:non-ribosomal peptide synthase/polyketide synthase [Amycolatopsis cihanbeyliensis]TQJ00437.1 amino acid adenylation domain-containing protein [Amycolatopsis cihanbeyliensis]
MTAQARRAADPSTITDLLRLRAEAAPGALAFRFLPSGDLDGTEIELSYGELDRRARQIAAALQRPGVVGERALLLYPPGLEFIAAFLGCAYAGVVAVPAYPHHTSPRLGTIATDSAAAFALTTRSQLRIVHRYTDRVPELARATWIATDADEVGAAEDWRYPAISADSLAFLQYTSGSTATPKGVMVSHGNILHNESLITAGFGTSSHSIVVGWLPLYHDMGLIGNVLQPLYLGAPCTLMSPLAFLQNPLRWLEVVSACRATVSGGPNFAYDLCSRRIRPEDAAHLDLGSWSVAFNGAEPVRAETMARFVERFGRHGFRPEAFYPCYGLAESTLFVSGADPVSTPVTLPVATEPLARDEVVPTEDVPTEDANNTETRLLVSSGRPGESGNVVVADPGTRRPCEEFRVGEIWVRGDSVASGYWKLPQENARTFGATLHGGDGTRYLRTGDLGFLLGGELYITGRLKDVLVVRGRNIYPQDVELTVERAHPAVRPGECAAFAVEMGEERLAVTAEAVLDEVEPAEVIEAIRRAVLAEHGAPVHTVALLRPRSIPKTSSGKIQRHACRSGLLDGSLKVLVSSTADEAPEVEARAESDAALRAELAAAPEDERRALIERTIRQEVAAAARVNPAKVTLGTTPAGAGLDSLLGVELQARLTELFGVSLPADLLWRQPTVGTLCDLVGTAIRDGADPAEPVVTPAPPEAEPLASSGQERLWLLDQLDPGAATYTVHFGIRIEGDVDAAHLAAALTDVVHRHAVLRTVLRERDGRVRQVVLPPAPVPLPSVDLPDEDALREHARAHAAAPFDLAAGPLLRAELVRRTAEAHVLLLALHHTVIDGASAAVLARDLAATYTARVHAAAPPPAPRLQFTDYAHWERGAIAGLDADREFWARALAGAERLALPGDRPRTADRTHRGCRVPLTLDPAVCARLVETGRTEDCTPYLALLTAYVTFLHRYTGQHDLSVGTVVANRGRPELRELVGFLANTVVVRADLSGAPTYRQLLRRVRELAGDALAHSRLPYAEIVRAATEDRAGADNPLFEASFVLENNPLSAVEVAGGRWRPLSWAPDGAVEGTAKFELSLALEEVDGGYAGVLECDADRFDPSTADRMAAQFGVLLADLAENPDREIGQANLLPGDERDLVLRRWNETAAPVPDTTAFPELFEAQVRRTPLRVAVEHAGRRLTYTELNALANRLARHLRARGVRRGAVVALLMPRGVELLASVLATFKAGAAYVPLDPNHPPHRHFQVLDGANAGLLVAAPELLEELVTERVPDCPVVHTTDLPALTEDGADLCLPLRADDLAYVIFTSGSTGAPKGAMVEHLGMINHLYAKIGDLDLHADDLVVQNASQCFDISVWQFLAALVLGARVEIVTEAVAGDPTGLFEHAATTGTTILEVVPSLLRVAVEELERRPDLLDLSPLRWLLVTGEALPPELARRWFAVRPDIPLLNAYGPTECSDDVAHYAMYEAGVLDTANTPIGSPVRNTRLYVLDAYRRPVPVGVLGELYVGGFGVGRGYAGRPDLTAERFLPDDLSGRPGALLYRTGDLVRWLPDGRIEFVGRVDNQVKVRGFRIELGEIEAVLGEHSGVRDVAVLVEETSSGDPRLVGYLVLDGVDVPAVRDWAGTRLPSYLMPAVFVVLDRLPLTANGKLDRSALPAVTVGDGEYVAPSSPVEETVAEIWAEVLELTRVSVREDFFALGGHSLAAVQVIARLRRAFGVEVPVRRLFAAPTVAGLARVVAELRAGGSVVPPEIRPVDRDRPLPVSFAQQRLWFLGQLEPGSVAYNVPGAVRIDGPLDVTALRAALDEVVRRHESLRTSFADRGDGPVQIVDPGAALPFELVDATADQVEDVTGRVARTPFDLTAGPLVRATLIRLDAREHVLVLAMHHIVSDGWSLGVLMRETSTLYQDFARGAEPSLPALPVQYADYAAWQREWLSGPVLDEQLGYWREQLDGAPPALELPTDRPRPATPSGRGGQLPVSFDADLVGGVRGLVRDRGATLFMGLLAGFQAVLGRFAGQDDVLVGSPVAGRSRTELEGLIGFFVNTVVLRTRLGVGEGFGGLLGRVRETTLDAFARQEVPFERLVEVLAPPRDLGRTPLFQVMFILQNAPGSDLRLGDAALKPVPIETGTAKFDLTLSLTENESGGVDGFLEYDTDVFDPGTAERLTAALHTLLGAAVADPDRPVGELPLLTEAERTEAIRAGEGPAAGIPEATIHELFAEQVARTPGAIALLHGDSRLTYRELDERAERIAGYLAGREEEYVGVHLGRSLDLVAAQLGILKAGKAYVSLDPAYPAERLRLMVETAGLRIVLVRDAERARAGLGDVLDLVPVDAPEITTADPVAHRRVRSDEAAYLIFTSGSTGTPNGVLGTHRGAVNRMAWMWREHPFQPGDRGALKTSPNFVDSIWETFGPLLRGVPSVILDDDTVLSPPELLAALDTHGVTRIVLVPSLLRVLLDNAEAGTAPRLTHWTSSGESLPESLARLFRERLPGRTLLNLYGQSEVAADSLACDASDTQATPTVPIGGPIDNIRILVLDKHLQPAPVNVPGELYVGGAGLALGYVNRPGLTAERFVADPTGSGARLYRTGDLVRWLPGGRIEFVGRVDNQVKVRGFRIELGEIELALARHPAVRETAVLVEETPAGDRRLIGYVVLDDAEIDVVRTWLLTRLPGYLVPSVLVPVDQLPLTPNGKLDRSALPAATPPASAEYAAPRGAVEELLAGIWAEVLDVPGVGAHDDFFALGGHSLIATQVISRVRQDLRVEVPLRRLFAAPTVAAFARVVDELRTGGAGPLLPEITRADRSGPLPVSFAQQRLWFLDQLAPGAATYNVPGAARIRGPVDVDVLRAVLRELSRRHEALRAGFTRTEDGPVLRLDPGATIELDVLDAAGEGELGEIIGRAARAPFDLAGGPLARAVLVRLGAREHVLVLTMHHIVSDGWSLGVLMRETTVLYEAFLRGAESPLPELPVQYVDYAAWQREWLSGEVLADQVAYWRKQLDGAPPALELPTDRPRPTVRRGRGGRCEVSLPADLVAGVRGLVRDRGATLFMGLLAGFQAVLGRFAGQDDVLVGSPVAGRSRTELEGLIGFFVNTLVLRTQLTPGEGFDGLLGRVRETTLDAFARQDVPFERLVDVLAPPRDLGRTPLFQVMFILQNAPGSNLRLADTELEPFDVDTGTAKFDLTLSLTERGEGVEGYLEYDTDLFEPETAGRLVTALHTLLGAAVADPDRPVGELPLLTEAERGAELDRAAGPRIDIPAPGVHELFARQAARTPDAIALAGNGLRLTYRELHERAGNLAAYLRSLDLPAESVIAVCQPRSASAVVSMLAVLKAGGAYLPVDLSAPAERLAFILRDAGARVLLTDRASRALLPADPAPTVVVDDIPGIPGIPDIPGTATEPASEPVTADRLAYVMYTSGSTGRPKGVSVPHRGVTRLALAGSHARIGPEDTLLHLAPPFFDAATFELWSGLLRGAKVVVADPDPLSLNDIAGAIRTHQVTTLWLTAPLFHQMVEHHLDALAGLRTLLAGGDVLAPERVRTMRERLPHVRLVNGYGPTENTTFTTTETVDRLRPGCPVPIGFPIDNTRVLLLDANQQPVPVGVVGELYTGGDGLARGYVGRPDLTADRFVPDPFTSLGARLYRTGDLGRRLADGRIEFAGRADNQVKVRGFRIELGEIESVLARHPQVRDAAVVVHETDARDRRLVAYVLAEDSVLPGLRDWAERKLPGYMVPSAMRALPEFPMTSSQKVDRRALPEVTMEITEQYVPPASPLEELIAGIWASVLELPRVGARDDFFAAGGNSLAATQVIARVRRMLDVEVPLRRLFGAPTVTAFARVVAELRASGESLSIPEITRTDRTVPPPASFAQQRLWFLDRLAPGAATYNVPGVVRIRGPLDVPVLRRVFDEIARRHESLRTSFADHGAGPVQVIAPDGRLPLEYRSHTGDLTELLDELIRAPFDLAGGLLARAVLVRLGAREHVLVLTMHHIVSDGWSLGVLMRETTVLYEAFLRGAESPLPELPVQYVDYAAWQREWLSGEVLADQVAYWRKQLDGAPPALELPTDRPRPTVRSGHGARVPVTLDAGLVEDMRALAQRYGATLYMALLAGFQTVLGRYAGQDDVLVGSPVAGRGRAELEGLIGFFVNTLVLRTKLQQDTGFAALLDQVRETTLNGFARQDVPFERLVEVLAPPRDLGRTPLFQVMFVLQNAPGGTLRLGEAELEAVESDTGTAKFDLTLSLTETERGAEGYLEFSTDLFEPATALRLTDSLRTLLTAAVADPERPVGELPLLPGVEREHLLAMDNHTTAEVPELPLHRLFERQVRRTPDADAVIGPEDRLSYLDLNRQANRLARRLRDLGAAPERVVGLLAEPGPRLALGLLAILKSGAAYLPLDPRLPAERATHLLHASSALAVLTGSGLSTAGSGVPELRLDDGWDESADLDPDDLPPLALPANTAYTIYTSGSTGLPKGVQVEHRQVVNYLAAITQRFELTPGLHYAMVQPLSVDACLSVVVPALFGGGTLHTLPYAAATDPEAVRTHFRRHHIDVLKIAPSHLAALLTAVPSRDLLPHKVLALGGEGSAWDWLRTRVAPLAPEHTVHIHYGPTETTVGVLTGRVDMSEPVRGPLAPLGRPLPNTRAYLLDARLEPVPVGTVGELYVAGAGVARGYLGRPGQTAAVFMADPYAPRPGSRMYRTGDLARRLPDGRYEFLGRADNQVKVRGFRIEPAEVDIAMETHPAVRRVATVTRPGPDGTRQLASYVVPAEGGTADQPPESATLRRYLRGLLPEYMIPTTVTFLSALPVTAQGKLDHAALPAPTQPGTEAHRPPGTPLEVQLAAIWSDVLDIASPGIDDDFFDLGGHSLLAVRLMSAVRDRLDYPVSLDLLFRAPTITRMAEALGDTDPTAALVELKPGAGTPLVLVHPVGGDLLAYTDLVHALDGPVLGLRAPDDGPADLTAIAERYATELRSAQPEGPYRLAGWSTGGLLAFELARVLGEDEIELLALLDTHLPAGDRPVIAERDDAPMVVRFAADVGRALGHTTGQAEFAALDPAQQRAELAAVLTEAELDRRLATYSRNATAVDGYRMRRTALAALLVTAEGNTDLAGHWRPWTGALDVHPVPGDHYGILRRPGVTRLARLLRERLAQPSRPGGTSTP